MVTFLLVYLLENVIYSRKLVNKEKLQRSWAYTENRDRNQTILIWLTPNYVELAMDIKTVLEIIADRY